MNKKETQEFKNWFRNSKVVDEKGKPLVVYHGGKKNINIFHSQKDIYTHATKGNFYFTSSKEVASTYAKKDFNIDIKKQNVSDIKLPGNIKIFYTMSKKSPVALVEVGKDGNLTGFGIEREYDKIFNQPIFSKFKKIKINKLKINPKRIGIYFNKKNIIDNQIYSIESNTKSLKKTIQIAKQLYKYNFLSFDKGFGINEAYLSLKNPLIIDYKGKYFYEDIKFKGKKFGKRTGYSCSSIPSIVEIERYARKNNYDGVIAKNIKDIGGAREIENKIADTYIVFNNKQIKSVNNQRTFNPDNQNIYLQ